MGHYSYSNPNDTRCNKIAYVSRRDARLQLREARKGKNSKPGPIRVYECKICGMWHSTSLSKKQARANQRKAAEARQNKLNDHREQK